MVGEAEVGGAQDVVGAGDDGGFDGVAELADVAGPGPGAEAVVPGGLDAGDGVAVFVLGAGDEAVGEGTDVVGAVAEGGELDDDDVEAVEEVLAEGAVGDGGMEVAVGGGDEADIDLEGLRAADAHDFAVFEDAEELDLDGGGGVADLVEEEGAALGALEGPAVEGRGTGEGPFFVPEELAFEEGFAEGGAVDGDEGAVGAQAVGV